MAARTTLCIQLLWASFGMLLSACEAQRSLYGPGSKVVNFHQANFDKLVMKSEAVWIVEFYAPWCGHCRQLAPEYDAAASMMNGIVRFGAVDCESGPGRSLCMKYEIEGYPTITVFAATLEGKSQMPKFFEGRHDRQSLVNYAVAQLPSDFVLAVNDHGLSSFLEDRQELPHSILFTDKAATTPMYKSLALVVRGRMVCGEAKQYSEGVVKKYNVVKFPTLIVIKSDGSQVQYSDKLSFPNLLKFFNEHKYAQPEDMDHYQALGIASDASDAEVKKAFRKLSLKLHPDKNKGGDKKVEALFNRVTVAYETLGDADKRAVYDQELSSDGSEVDTDFYTRNKDITNIQSWWQFQQTMNKGGVWLIEFYTSWCGPCQQFSAEYKKLPMALEGLNLDKSVHLAAVNCEKQQEVCQRLNVGNYPTVTMMKPQENTEDRYEGDRTAAKIAEWVQLSLDSPVVEIHNPRQFAHLVDKSKELWIVDFMSPGCGPCQAIKGDVRRMASKLRGLAKVGMFSCTESQQHSSFCQEKGVQGYPTIMAFGRSVGAAAKKGVELDAQSGNRAPGISAMSIAATILKLNAEGQGGQSSAGEAA